MDDAKPKMPDTLRALATNARARLQKNRGLALDDVLPEHQKAGDYLQSPFCEDEWELWACLLLDAFGTRNYGVANAFMAQLADMVPKEWDAERQCHRLDMPLYTQALSIVCSLKPRNEAEAAIAVHCVALHLTTFKVTDRMGSQSWLDPKSAAALAAVTKAFAAQVKGLREMQKPSRAKRQVIKVQKNVTVNYTDARSVHIPGGGGDNSGNQPDATRALRARARDAGRVIEVPALPSPDASGNGVPIPCGEGETPLPITRRGERIRSAEG